jgi:hypothetical protein
MSDTVHERIEALVGKRPGLTESEIAAELFGEEGYQQRVNQDCRWLVGQGRIARRGNGGVNDPYRYFKA